MDADRELTQDEVDELGIDAVAFEWRWGWAVRLSDLSQDERDWLAR
jgi:hypothetical protein